MFVMLLREFTNYETNTNYKAKQTRQHAKKQETDRGFIRANKFTKQNKQASNETNKQRNSTQQRSEATLSLRYKQASQQPISKQQMNN